VRCNSQRASDDKDYPRKLVYLTEVISKVTVSDRSDLDTVEVGDKRSDAPMDMAMEIATAVSPIAVDTASTA
jgi:hypothetical protein